MFHEYWFEFRSCLTQDPDEVLALQLVDAFEASLDLGPPPSVLPPALQLVESWLVTPGVPSIWTGLTASCCCCSVCLWPLYSLGFRRRMQRLDQIQVRCVLVRPRRGAVCPSTGQPSPCDGQRLPLRASGHWRREGCCMATF